MGSEWSQKTVHDIAVHQKGFAFKSKDYQETGCPVVRVSNFTVDSIDCAGLYFVSEEVREATKVVELLTDDVVIATVGSWPKNPDSIVGKTIRVPSDVTGSLLNQNAVRLRAKSLDNHDQLFLYYLLKDQRFSDYIVSTAQGSANQASITLKDIYAYSFQYPSISERNFISRILNSLDEKIKLNRQTNQTLEKIAQALFKSWFVDFDPVIDNALAAGNPIPEELQDRAERRKQQLAKPDHKPLPEDILQLFPNEFELTEELGWVPKGWEVKSLDKIAHYENGLALQKFRPENEAKFLPVLKIAHLKQGFTDGKEKASSDIKPSCIIDDGDIVFSWSGSLMVDIWCGGKAALNQHLFKVTSETYPRWFYYLLTTHHLAEFQRIAADKAVTMGHIKREHLSQAKCAVPSWSLLKTGSKHIESIIKQQVMLRQESKELEKLRDTLLPKLISGELRLPSEALQDVEQQLAETIA
jgi:type I restriction enzyme S subunit